MTAATARPRVLHVITGLHVGGAEMMLYKLLTARDARSLESVVVALGTGGVVGERLAAAGVPVHHLGARPDITAAGAAVHLARLIRQVRPHLVQGWLLHGNLMATAAAVLAGYRGPVLWNVRWAYYGLDVETRATRAAMRISGLMARHPAKIVFNSRRAVEQHASLGYPPTRAVVIPNGFDVERFRPSRDARSAVRAFLEVRAETTIIGMAARYHPMKAHGTALEALARLLAAGVDVTLVLAGRGLDASNRELRDLLLRHGVQNHVRLLGEWPDTERLFAALDICWLSSRARGLAEGFPNVLGEAMACGVPCVATDVGDASVVVGDAGTIVPADESDALAAATLAVMRLPEEGRETLRQRARDRVVRHFNLKEIVAQYHQLYRAELDQAN